MRSRPGLPLRAVALCLVLGAIANFVVAWLCAARLDPLQARLTLLDQTDPLSVPPEYVQQVSDHPHAQRFSDDQIMMGRERRFGVERRGALTMPYWQALTRARAAAVVAITTSHLATRISAGWPALALVGERWMDPKPAMDLMYGGVAADPDTQFLDRGLLPLRFGGKPALIGSATGQDAGVMPRLLPLKPLWPGFMINTVLYAPIIWLMVFGPLALRRVIRRRRNLCERCGYPRGASTTCSECGASLPGRHSARSAGGNSLDFPAAQVQ